MQISRAFMAIAMLAKHDGVENINTTQPDGVWRQRRSLALCVGEARQWL